MVDMTNRISKEGWPEKLAHIETVLGRIKNLHVSVKGVNKKWTLFHEGPCEVRYWEEEGEYPRGIPFPVDVDFAI